MATDQKVRGSNPLSRAKRPEDIVPGSFCICLRTTNNSPKAYALGEFLIFRYQPKTVVRSRVPKPSLQDTEAVSIQEAISSLKRLEVTALRMFTLLP